MPVMCECSERSSGAAKKPTEAPIMRSELGAAAASA
jgi:hypothetical protein